MRLDEHNEFKYVVKVGYANEKKLVSNIMEIVAYWVALLITVFVTLFLLF